jgi:hypothetical protein
MNANFYIFQSMFAGIPLPLIAEEYARMTSVMAALGQESMLNLSRPCVQSIHHYMGLTDDPLCSKGDILDYETEYQSCMRNNQGYFSIRITIYRLISSCIFNDLAEAHFQATRWLAGLVNMPSGTTIAVTFVWAAIAFLEIETTNKRKAFRIARRGAKMLKKLSMTCPFNFSHMRLLLDAEVAAAKGQEKVAIELYSHSIACAKSSSSLMIEAFGKERCGRFLYNVQRRDEARSFLGEACQVYESWGGMAKVARLKQDMRVLFSTALKAA